MRGLVLMCSMRSNHQPSLCQLWCFELWRTSIKARSHDETAQEFMSHSNENIHTIQRVQNMKRQSTWDAVQSVLLWNKPICSILGTDRLNEGWNFGGNIPCMTSGCNGKWCMHAVFVHCYTNRSEIDISIRQSATVYIINSFATITLKILWAFVLKVNTSYIYLFTAQIMASKCMIISKIVVFSLYVPCT
jgi:hypothetical protein